MEKVNPHIFLIIAQLGRKFCKVILIPIENIAGTDVSFALSLHFARKIDCYRLSVGGGSLSLCAIIELTKNG